MAGETQEQIKTEAQDTVQRGGNIREKIRDLTLRVLNRQTLDPGQVRAVVRAMTEGIAEGAPKAADMRRALSEGFRGLDEALTKSAEATRQVLKEGRQLGEASFRQGLEDLKRLEENFLGTVGEVAERTQDQVRSGLQELVTQARRAGTESGRKAAEIASALSARMGALAMDSAKFGMDAAREAGSRVAEAASGMLLGMAEALVPARKAAPKAKAKPRAKPKQKAKARRAKPRAKVRAKAGPKRKRKSKSR
jgi:hypothetical protein